ncbi:glycoside hydrolase family 5 protein [Sphingomonas profundi]|uniref:glycoside hydrolase family 5 protein n=1 Tax=Alterirhizorhabdus profundi TaxID=2681549 RepID=UPI001E35082B|nr:glycoside hydrolase family 5 protein [Sphingomonas profundi]
MIRRPMGKRRALALCGALGAAALAGALLLAAPAPPVAKPGRPLPQRFTGVNLASGEFGGKRIPGRYGFDYVYPTPAVARPFLAAGMTAVRVPVKWRRLQPAPFAPLDPVEMQRLDAALQGLRGFRLVILDVHDYGKFAGQKLDQPATSGAILADLWTKLATRYRSDPRIAFGLMNEPNGIDAAVWAGVAAEALKAVRATGAKNLVLVPGTRWSGAHSWTNGTPSNADALAGLRDPANNMAFEMHQYLDSDSSGTHEDCVAPEAAAARLGDATEWLRRNRARGFLGEFGVGPTPPCLAALDALLTAMDRAPDVWLGWTYWAGGAMWGPYAMSVQPTGGAAKPQMAVLARHLAAGGR